jgi:hypothetical protein
MFGMLLSMSSSKNIAEPANALGRLGLVPSSNIGVNSSFALWQGERGRITKIVVEDLEFLAVLSPPPKNSTAAYVRRSVSGTFESQQCRT